jgi:hypothetical protein
VLLRRELKVKYGGTIEHIMNVDKALWVTQLLYVSTTGNGFFLRACVGLLGAAELSVLTTNAREHLRFSIGFVSSGEGHPKTDRRK